MAPAEQIKKGKSLCDTVKLKVFQVKLKILQRAMGFLIMGQWEQVPEKAKWMSDESLVLNKGLPVEHPGVISTIIFIKNIAVSATQEKMKDEGK